MVKKAISDIIADLSKAMCCKMAALYKNGNNPNPEEDKSSICGLIFTNLLSSHTHILIEYELFCLLSKDDK